MVMLRSSILLPLVAVVIAGCSDTVPSNVDSGIHVRMNFAESTDFFANPFPSENRLLPSGLPDLEHFPNPTNNTLAKTIIDIAATSQGFGTTTPIWFSLDGAIDTQRFPSVHQSLEANSPAFLMALDDGSYHPIDVRFLADGGPYGSPNLLAMLPVQGIPLRANTVYAAVIRRSLTDTPLAQSAEMKQIIAGKAPAGLSVGILTQYLAALQQIVAHGVPENEIAGVTVFSTGDPIVEYSGAVQGFVEGTIPTPTKPFVRNEMFNDYCVYETTIGMPVAQEGTPPYTSAGGRWVFDDKGNPIIQRIEEANFVVTIPRSPMPVKGYPMVVLSRTGAGGARPLVDRGVQAETGGPAIEAGTGPAIVFAKAGFAGTSVDGPHGGLRNVTKGDEQFLVFNIGNPVALRDNIRQSAAELALLPHILEQVTIDVTDCPGATTPDGSARFDLSTLTIMGHSMGASIIPLTVAFEPKYRAMLLSGGGGSFLANVVYKQKPLATKPLAESLMGLAGSGYSLSEVDPLLGLLQWAGESADVPPYARYLRFDTNTQPRHILMMQGIVDHYIMPPIANAMTLSLGLDLAGDALDKSTPELQMFVPIEASLDLVQRKKIPLPAMQNADMATAVVVQHAEDGIQDGHEVVFQTEPPKHQIRCFLESLVKGTPRVPTLGSFDSPCD